LALQRLETWAALSDPDFGHTKDSAGLALQMYDGLMSNGLCAPDPDASSRRTLQIAALLRNVGRTKRADQSQKNSYRLMRRLQAPVGLPAETLEMAALVVRYHRGTLPKPGNKRLAKLSKSRKRSFTLLAGILRLADALDRLSGGKIRNLKVAGTDEFITVRAQGTPQDARAWEKIAAARYLLETACDRPVLVQAADRFTVYRGR
jgi:exopolyphosphatase/guanosine-5'-triphosphate,3'-diphosphate pyrophosphatase